MADNVNEPVLAALTLDRALPVGDSPGADFRGRVHVKVSNGASEPIPVTLVVAPTPGAAPFFEGVPATVTTPGAEQVLFSVSVPLSILRQLRRLAVICRMDCVWRLELSSVVVASGRTSPGYPESVFTWNPERPAVAGSSVELFFTQSSYQPVSVVEAYLQAADLPA